MKDDATNEKESIWSDSRFVIVLAMLSFLGVCSIIQTLAVIALVSHQGQAGSGPLPVEIKNESLPIYYHSAKRNLVASQDGIPVVVINKKLSVDVTNTVDVNIDDHNFISPLPVKVEDHNLNSPIPVTVNDHSLISPLPVTVDDHNLTLPLPVMIK